MYPKKIIPLLFLTVLCLSGCGVHKSQFDCDIATGMNCKSMGRINKIIDENDSNDSSANIRKLSSNQNIKEQLESFPDQAINASLTHDLDVIRIPEQTMRIWVAPYKNNSDEYVDAFQMHIVTQEGHWHSK